MVADPRDRPQGDNDACLEAPRTAATLSVVLCGSFRRDPEGLARVHGELAKHFKLLSPTALDFVDPSAEFVRLPHEVAEDLATIEDRHLNAIVNADFVWLHCPDGYVGTSAAMELGHARALGIPIFGSCAPSDPALREYVTLVTSPTEASGRLSAAPGKGLVALQRYYARASERRGWDNETPQDTLLLLTEELGELARAVRKGVGIRRDGSYPPAAIGHELADVQLYLVHLATALGIDIAQAVTIKEADNARRFAARYATAEAS